MIESCFLLSAQMRVLSKILGFLFFFSSRRRHTRFDCDWSSDVCSSDLPPDSPAAGGRRRGAASPARRPGRARRTTSASRAAADAAPRSVAGGSRRRASSGSGTRATPRCRSEERRVGEESRSRWSPHHYKKKLILLGRKGCG